MVNFLPYEDVVLEPGERLNLVVGPNGSGKSTLVCAICIALCGPLKVGPCSPLAADDMTRQRMLY